MKIETSSQLKLTLLWGCLFAAFFVPLMIFAVFQ